jgi:hypothetical protein
MNGKVADDQKERRERAALAAFFADAGITPDRDPVKLRGQGNPDFSCSIRGEKIAFEVTKLTDQDFERLMGGRAAWERRLCRTLEGLAPDVLEALRKRFDGCVIDVRMRWPLRPDELISGAALLADSLLALDPNAQGELASRDAAHSNFRPIRIYRSNSRFHPKVVVVGEGAWVNVQFSPTLQKKLEKSYPAEHHPVELLVYTVGLPPNAPDWKEDARTVMEQCIEQSGFRRIWLHDQTSQPFVIEVVRPH